MLLYEEIQCIFLVYFLIVLIYTYWHMGEGGGGRAGQLVESLCHKTGSPGLHSRWGFWKIWCDLILLSAISSLGGPLSPWGKWVPRDFRGVEVRPTLTADDSAVLVVPNVKRRMESQYSISPFWVSITCYGKAILFYRYKQLKYVTVADLNSSFSTVTNIPIYLFINFCHQVHFAYTQVFLRYCTLICWTIIMSVICQKSHVNTFKVSHFFFKNADDVRTISVAVKVIMHAFH